MDLKQVLVFALSLAVCAQCSLHPCYNEEDLENAASHKLRHHYHQPGFPNQASPLPHTCDLELYKRDQTRKGRSISPWAYVQRNMPGHFPSIYYEAQCLCEGCIVLNEDGDPEENHNYNSAPVVQSRVFLKRALCEETGEGRRYRLEPVNVNVTVACTCVRPLVVVSD